MILKATDNLCRHITGVQKKEPLIDSLPEKSILVWDGNKLISPETIAKNIDITENSSTPLDLGEPEELAQLIPRWMKEALLESQILTMKKDEYYSLPEEVRSELEVLNYY